VLLEQAEGFSQQGQGACAGSGVGSGVEGLVDRSGVGAALGVGLGVSELSAVGYSIGGSSSSSSSSSSDGGGGSHGSSSSSSSTQGACVSYRPLTHFKATIFTVLPAAPTAPPLSRLLLWSTRLTVPLRAPTGWLTPPLSSSWTWGPLMSSASSLSCTPVVSTALLVSDGGGGRGVSVLYCALYCTV